MSALEQARTCGCGPGDLAGLVRDALRRHLLEEGRRELPWPVVVPAVDPWPDVAMWAAGGITAAPGSTPGTLRIIAVAGWRPGWMRDDHVGDLDEFAAGRTLRQLDHAVRADPVWEQATGLAHYRSLAQRQAVRTLLSSAEDATVLVLLPTGSGKSLVGLTHPLTVGGGMVSVVVVPTTSLALDQELQLRECLGRVHAPDAHLDFAFHSGLSAGVRQEIRDRVRTGGQRVVFTSPEALFGPLGEVDSQQAARQGRLGQFVLDEAHMATTWGAGFRPEYQTLGAFREELIGATRESGHNFRTILMTATATRRDVETLWRTFGRDGRPLVAGGAVALRAELAFEAAECEDAPTRRERVQEALRYLPRPIFVYATKKDDVADLASAARRTRNGPSCHGHGRLRAGRTQRRARCASRRRRSAPDCRPRVRNLGIRPWN